MIELIPLLLSFICLTYVMIYLPISLSHKPGRQPSLEIKPCQNLTHEFSNLLGQLIHASLVLNEKKWCFKNDIKHQQNYKKLAFNCIMAKITFKKQFHTFKWALCILVSNLDILSFGKIQVKSILAFNFTPVTVTMIKKTTDNKCCTECGGPSFTVNGNVNWCIC